MAASRMSADYLVVNEEQSELPMCGPLTFTSKPREGGRREEVSARRPKEAGSALYNAHWWFNEGTKYERGKLRTRSVCVEGRSLSAEGGKYRTT